MACNAASSYIYVMLYLNSIEMSNAKKEYAIVYFFIVQITSESLTIS